MPHVEKTQQSLTLNLLGVCVDLAIAIALVSRWHVWQWQVPKAWVRIFLGCRVMGIVMTSLCSSAESQFFLLSSLTLSKDTVSCPRGES